MPSYEIHNISFAQLVFVTKPAVWRALLMRNVEMVARMFTFWTKKVT